MRNTTALLLAFLLFCFSNLSFVEAQSDISGYEHIILTGQSLSTGHGGTPLLSTTQKYNNKMLDASKSQLIPLIETLRLNGIEGETIASGMTNQFTSSSSSNTSLIVTNHGRGNQRYEAIKKGTEAYISAIDSVKAAHSIAKKKNMPYKVSAVIVIHGESDAVANVSKDTYKGYLKEWQQDYETDIKAITGQSEPVVMLIDQVSSYTAYTQSGNSDVPQAQLEAAEESGGKIILLGPKYFLRYVDAIHLNNESYRLLGEYYGKVYKTMFVDQKTWKPLEPTKVTVGNNNKLRVIFNVPSGGLAFDTQLVPQKSNYGFEYTDSEGGNSAKITNVSISTSKSIVITFDRKPTGTNPMLSYAFKGVAGSWSGVGPQSSINAPKGNLRDQDQVKGQVSNTPLYNWAVQFNKAVGSNLSDFDLNTDSKVNTADLSIFLSKFLTVKEDDILRADFDYDAKVNSSDLSLILFRISNK